MMFRQPIPPGDSPSQTLIVRQTISATAEFLFEAWTRPERLKEWWGPEGIKCVEAQVDLRVGGSYRLANQFPDGRIIWISGEYQLIEAPRKLVYTWRAEPGTGTVERVTVQFVADGAQTEVIVAHERIPDETTRASHQLGWQGCLTRLVTHTNGVTR